jgi:hypothetical protein
MTTVTADSILNTRFHKRLPEFGSVDRIALEVVPRYKQGYLSGDEWRQHVRVVFYYKGLEVASYDSNSLESAILQLGSVFLNRYPISNSILKAESELCDQPSCAEKAVYCFTLKQEFSTEGHKLDASECHFKKYRQFCEKHSTRGDCDREDCDDNYVKEKIVKGKSPST